MTNNEFLYMLLGWISGSMLVPALVIIANRLRKKKCWFRHDWQNYQGTFKVSDLGMSGRTNEQDVVVAWKTCKRCAKSKFVHMLV